jgi:predicted nucleic acid-binding protein
MWLIDTNVLSDMRKLRTRRASPELDRWVSTFSFSDAFISAIGLLELRTGELRLARKDAAQAEVLREWLDDQIMPTFAVGL